MRPTRWLPVDRWHYSYRNADGTRMYLVHCRPMTWFQGSRPTVKMPPSRWNRAQIAS